MKKYLFALIAIWGMSNMGWATTYLTCWNGGNFPWVGPPSPLTEEYQKPPYELITTEHNSEALNGWWKSNGIFSTNYPFKSKQDAYKFCDMLRKECQHQIVGSSGAYMAYTGGGYSSFIFATYRDANQKWVEYTCDQILVPE